MKSLLTAAFLLFVFSGLAQSNKSKLPILKSTEWVNKDLSYLKFSDDFLTYYLDAKKHQLGYEVSNDTLVFKETFLEGGSITVTEKLRFKIKLINKNKLVIYPLDDQLTLDQEAYKRFDYLPFFSKKEFVFYSKKNVISKLDYKKITFHGSTCFGTCPSFTVEINKDGKVYYQGRIYTKKFTGNFEGMLPKEEQINLAKKLNRSQISLINQNWKQNSHVTDQPRYNYIVELSDGEKIEINTNDQHPVLDSLSEYLVTITDKFEPVKSKYAHAYVKPSLRGYEIVYREEDD